MFTFSNRNGESLLGPKLQPDITADNLRHNSKIELLRLRGRYINSHFELDVIQAELNRRQHRECLAYTVLIAGALILISLLI